MKTNASDIIAQIRATPNGEKVPMIYQAHMAARYTEDQLDHARSIVHELFELLEGSVEGPGLRLQREDEINGLLHLWGLRVNGKASETSTTSPTQ